MIERGEEVIVARHGKPVAQLVPITAKKSILGVGTGDLNYRYGVSDEEAIAAMSDEEVEVFYGYNDRQEQPL